MSFSKAKEAHEKLMSERKEVVCIFCKEPFKPTGKESETTIKPFGGEWRKGYTCSKCSKMFDWGDEK